jgi:hypothetical protein
MILARISHKDSEFYCGHPALRHAASRWLLNLLLQILSVNLAKQFVRSSEKA